MIVVVLLPHNRGVLVARFEMIGDPLPLVWVLQQPRTAAIVQGRISVKSVRAQIKRRASRAFPKVLVGAVDDSRLVRLSRCVNVGGGRGANAGAGAVRG